MHKYIQLIAFFILAAPSAASADPMSVYGSSESGPRTATSVSVRAGLGSLYGPAFRAGQPEYAHSDGFDWENREPFTTPHQVVTTFGLAGTLSIGVGSWAVGPTIVGGFNATRSTSGSFADIDLRDSFTGSTFGAGLHAARVSRAWRLTLDVVGSYSKLQGKVEWSYSDFFADDTLKGAGEWSTSYFRVAALAGAELDVGPVFVFVNGGAQFLPEQTRMEHVSGSYPEAHTRDAFNVAIESRVERKGASRVTYAEELSLAASAGLGLRF